MWKKGAAAIFIAIMCITSGGCEPDARESYAFILPDGFHGWVWVGESWKDGQDKSFDDGGLVVIVVPPTGVANVAYVLESGWRRDAFRTSAGKNLSTAPLPNEPGIRARGITTYTKENTSISGETFFVGTEEELAMAQNKSSFVEEVWHIYHATPSPPQDSGLRTQD